ncbi:probable CoA ligase CCL13 [Amaranthus tricolor]|uniref:probable CoA ligase CCL13 n=1 Tax=Amaranthus tricolor TaxID=29722 RepID=UPI0025842FEC|nr:probable CoA ligase CCL13 [Amaranthus tricolor]
MEGLMQCGANYVPLSPISFLERAARVYGDQISVIYGGLAYTWKQTHQRCMQLASALSSLGICYGDCVVALLPNIPELYELHFGVPFVGGVLSTINPKINAPTLSSMFEELLPKFIFLDYKNLEPVLQILNHSDYKTSKPPIVVLTSTSNCVNKLPNHMYYNELLSMGQSDSYKPVLLKDECDPILVNYTSGSTGRSKGVVYSHRATYLNTLGEILRSDLRQKAKVVFLWTADMFRANGWGFTWAIAALGGTNVFLYDTNILPSICMYKVTHLSGQPSILTTILDEFHTNPSEVIVSHKVYAHIAGVMPSSDAMERVQKLGIEVVYRYGMTEILGPPVITKLHNNRRLRNELNIVDHIMEEFDVKDPNSMESVVFDGKSIGEVMFRGNGLMMGYLNDLTKTEKAFKGGWFHTGDLAIRHKDGSIQLKDRLIDVIVSKGERISSLEIEAVLLTHPKILEAAVVAMPDTNHMLSDDEVPCAFLKLANGSEASQGEIIQFCRERLPNQMIPKLVVFGNLAISSTGKVQKFILRQLARNLSSQLI